MVSNKARQIFEDTYTACRVHIKDWGIEYNPSGKAVGFNNVHTEEVVCQRTINDMRKLVETEKKMLKFEREFGRNDDYTTVCENALMMVESTIDNAEKLMNDWR